MPPRKAHYDPFVSDEAVSPPELPPVRGMMVEKPGLYISADDASALLALYATQYHAEGRTALLAAAGVFAEMSAGDALDALPEPPGGVPAVEEPVASPTIGREVYIPTIEADDVVAEIRTAAARIEVFPNEDGSYWYARPVNANGGLIGATLEGVNHDGVIEIASRQWPDCPIYEIPDALHDSVWSESGPQNTWNGRPRPSTRRLFGQ